MTRVEIFDLLRPGLANLSSKMKNEISEQSKLGEDLEIGQGQNPMLEFNRLRNFIELEFEVKIPDHKIPTIDLLPEVTVGQIVDLLCRLLK